MGRGVVDRGDSFIFFKDPPCGALLQGKPFRNLDIVDFPASLIRYYVIQLPDCVIKSGFQRSRFFLPHPALVNGTSFVASGYFDFWPITH